MLFILFCIESQKFEYLSDILMMTEYCNMTTLIYVLFSLPFCSWYSFGEITMWASYNNDNIFETEILHQTVSFYFKSLVTFTISKDWTDIATTSCKSPFYNSAYQIKLPK